MNTFMSLLRGIHFLIVHTVAAETLGSLEFIRQGTGRTASISAIVFGELQRTNGSGLWYGFRGMQIGPSASFSMLLPCRATDMITTSQQMVTACL